MVHGEEGSEAVRIEGGLAEAVAVSAEDVVHRDVIESGVRVSIAQEDTADIVGDGVGAGIAANAEPAKSEGEREVPGGTVLEIVGASGLVLAEVDHSLLAKEEGEQAARENHEEGEVEEKSGQIRPPERSSYEGEEECGPEESPPADEPWSAVDIIVCPLDAVGSFEESGEGEEYEGGGGEEWYENFDFFHFHLLKIVNYSRGTLGVPLG